MICKDLQPISVVEDRGFIAFVKTLNPCYKIPSRRWLMEGITDMYKNSVNISLELKRITDEWGITQKVLAVVTDNGPNVVSAYRSEGTDALIEMRRYLEERVILRDQDPLHWWKEHEQTFPSLSRFAVKYLGIVASCVPAERVFSKTGELISQRRSRLKGKNVNMLLFLNKNLKM
ncbi:zinc finger BED domain-containing protein 4-like [Megalops cyprinoides]|uniref:zinc finger BED domain-containing protein 4-like n=1 Tax=Megalops cyprinoides TaxID=118141 RepID=UPI0018652FAB|nr:zinc finger BED domain-containing protein 4-like [Megalops cyprinoides]